MARASSRRDPARWVRDVEELVGQLRSYLVIALLVADTSQPYVRVSLADTHGEEVRISAGDGEGTASCWRAATTPTRRATLPGVPGGWLPGCATSRSSSAPPACGGWGVEPSWRGGASGARPGRPRAAVPAGLQLQRRSRRPRPRGFRAHAAAAGARPHARAWHPYAVRAGGGGGPGVAHRRGTTGG